MIQALHMLFKIIITPLIIIIILDWFRLLRKLFQHDALLPANRYLCLIPGIGNLYLRLYFKLENPVPGTNDPKIRDIRKGETMVRGCRANVENEHAGGTGYTFY